MIQLIDSDTILETARLLLEPLIPEHARPLFPVLADAQIYSYIPEDSLADEEALRRRFQQLARRRSPSGAELWLNWAIYRKDEHDYIGTLQATVFANHLATIAYLLNPVFWGYGYAQEACRRMLGLLFDGYALDTVSADVDTRNNASVHLLERLGFQRTATRQAADHFKGVASDEYHYELTAAAWNAQRSAPPAS
jgi:[ribosomal protein S5]-alanine N-acetyltransferase